MPVFTLPTALAAQASVPYVVTAKAPTGLTVYLAGQNITNYVREMSIQLKDTLGQGAGAGTGTSGRTTSLEFLTSLGPVSSAKGAGERLVGGPYLVRLGEVRILDASNTCIFGGFAADYRDASLKTRVYTDVLCHDYWQSLDRIIVNEVFDGQTDIYIIKYLLNKYAPWVNLSQLTTAAGFTFGPKNYQHKTLMKCLQDVADASGYQIWIDPNKVLYYVRPTNSANAAFSLSDTPNFATSFPHLVDKYETDDNALINRVYFYGGKHLSSDLTIDLSAQCNGVSKVYTIPYYPHKASDGKFHILVSGVDQTFGYTGGTGNQNVLTTDGGTAHLLLNIDSHTIEADSPYASGTALSVRIRREIPLVVVLTDQSSYQKFGTYYDGSIVDTSVFDIQTALQRCRVLLLEQSYGLTTLQVRCWRPGLKPGTLLYIKNTIKGINNTYIVQEVSVVPLGGGNFAYDVTVGAWNWNLVDTVLQLAQAATPADTASQDNTAAIQVQQLAETIHTSDAVTKKVRGGSGSYLWRTTPVGDGKDIYWGLWQW